MPDDRDAELIALCDRIVTIAPKLLVRCQITGDLDYDPEIAAKFDAALGALDQLRPTTPADAVAMARAALARVPRDANGDPFVDDGANQMLVKVATWLAGADLDGRL